MRGSARTTNSRLQEVFVFRLKIGFVGDLQHSHHFVSGDYSTAEMASSEWRAKFHCIEFRWPTLGVNTREFEFY